MYDTAEEVNQKLSGSVVLFQNVPVYVHEGKGKGKGLAVKYKNLRSGEEKVNGIHEPGWEFRNFGPRLGYTNVDLGSGSYKEAVYVTRAAVRRSQSTQGLSSHNLKIPRLRGSQRLSLSPTGLNFGSIYNKEYFLDMLERKYPSVEDVYRGFQTDSWLTSRAFSRQFSARRHDIGPFYLEYRGRDIGYSDDLSKWKVSPDFDHLRETLDHLELKVA